MSKYNPNGVPMGAVIDVYLKHDLPFQPFKRWEARRRAVEEVRQGAVPQVLRN